MDAFSGVEGDVRRDWQIAVDTIYGLVASGLVRLWSGELFKEHGSPGFYEETLEFGKVLAQINPDEAGAYTNYPSYGIPWVGFDLCMTDTTRHLLAKHGLA